jgi:hypothetical protein
MRISKTGWLLLDGAANMRETHGEGSGIGQFNEEGLRAAKMLVKAGYLTLVGWTGTTVQSPGVYVITPEGMEARRLRDA